MKKEEFDIIKNEKEFKLIIKRDQEGNILSLMEKPNFRRDQNSLCSGAHVFPNPLFNHVDYFLSGAFAYKEYPEVRGSTNYGYTLSGSAVIV